MAIRAGWITPILQSPDIERSMRWWERLGFERVDVVRDGHGTIVWARMHCEGGAIMFTPAEGALRTTPGERVPFYMYAPDLEALRARLRADGVDPGPVSHPHYMPKGEICLTDPDGYTVLVGHWDDEDHQKWERERQSRI